MTKREIVRTYWDQGNIPLVYVASTRSNVVPGTKSGMAVAILKRVKNPGQAQLISSLTTCRGLHAPVIDIDFPSTSDRIVAPGRGTIIRVIGPKPEAAARSILQEALFNCHFSKRSTAELVPPTDDVILAFSVPVELIRSKTVGHFHLYINRRISWNKYEALLRALRTAGVIGEDFFTLSVASMQSYVRNPRTTVIGC